MNDKNFITPSNLQFEILECRDVSARLGDYIDNDLPPVERKSIEGHLDNCTECAAFFASYNHVIQSAAELREPEQPLAIDVQNRLRKALNDRLGINLPFIA
jgi:predicted anti-sigma-YlaC factor YlaD